MGYYSKVKIMCEDKIFNELKEIFMDESYRIRPDNVSLVIDFSPKDVYCVEWDWCKWYDDAEYFPGVYKIMKLLKKIESCDYEHGDYEGYNFVFTRIGEEVGDTETIETTSDFYFDIIVDIKAPFTTEPIPVSKLDFTEKL